MQLTNYQQLGLLGLIHIKLALSDGDMKNVRLRVGLCYAHLWETQTRWRLCNVNNKHTNWETRMNSLPLLQHLSYLLMIVRQVKQLQQEHFVHFCDIMNKNAKYFQSQDFCYAADAQDRTRNAASMFVKHMQKPHTWLMNM